LLRPAMLIKVITFLTSIFYSTDFIISRLK